MNERSVSREDGLTAWVAGTALLETLRWSPGEGYFLLENHLNRLRRSAEQLGWPADLARIGAALDGAAAGWPIEPCRVRLCVDAKGVPSVAAVPLTSVPLPRPMRVGWAVQAVAASETRLYHKTTDRRIYDAARAVRPGVDDVVLYNERGEVTESTLANLVVERAGGRVTPPVACGLLPGVYREYLLARGEIREAIIPMEELRAARSFYLINSVREWMPAVWSDAAIAG